VRETKKALEAEAERVKASEACQATSRPTTSKVTMQAQVDTVTQSIEPRQNKSDPCPSKKLKLFSFMSAHNATKSIDTISQQTDVMSVMNKFQAFVCSDLVELTVFNDPSFTILRPIALQMFSAPCSSAASERVFSQAGLIMRPTRSRLSKAMLSKLVFLKCNKQLL
jgi:hAT family C-terminal dimerisation region